MYGVVSSFGEVVAIFNSELEAVSLANYLKIQRRPVYFHVDYFPEYKKAIEYIEQNCME
jgi:hypothetical protein